MANIKSGLGCIGVNWGRGGALGVGWGAWGVVYTYTIHVSPIIIMQYIAWVVASVYVCTYKAYGMTCAHYVYCNERFRHCTSLLHH